MEHDDGALRSPVRAPVRFESTRARRIAGAIAVLALAGWMPAHARCQVETVELPVKMVGSRATATVGINGKPVPLTVDSGAFFSMLTDAAASQLDLTTKRNAALRVEGLTGRVDTRTTVVDKLKLFKGEIDHVEFVVGGNEPGAGTMGLMGRNILWFTDTEYDLAHGAIRFHFPNDDCAKVGMAYWAGSSPVTEVDLVPDYRSKAPAIRAWVKLNGSAFVALFDSGATTVVSARTARRADVDEPRWTPAGTSYGAGRGSARLWTAPFDRFEIGNETICDNRLLVADYDLGDSDLLLGIDFFLSHRIYVSKQQSKMFVTYNGGPVFALDRHAPARIAAGAPPRADPLAAAEAGPDPGAGDAQVATADQLARRAAASAARRDYESALTDLDRSVGLEPTTAAYLAQRGVRSSTSRAVMRSASAPTSSRRRT